MTKLLRKLWRTSRSGQAENSATRPVGNELLLSDRRVVKRHSDPLSATVSYGIAASEEPVGIHNFSDKGLCFRGAVRYPVGAGLEITTTLPQTRLLGGSRVRYSARVVRATMQCGEFITAAAIYGCQTLPKEDPEAAVRSGSNGKSTDVDTTPAVSETDGPTDQRGPRRFSRYNCASLVQFRNSTTGQIVSGELVNLSLAGCCVRTASPCAPGTELEVALQAGDTRIHVHGQVKGSDSQRSMAVEFDGDLAERLQRLPRFIRMISAGTTVSSRHQNN